MHEFIRVKHKFLEKKYEYKFSLVLIKCGYMQFDVKKNKKKVDSYPPC